MISYKKHFANKLSIDSKLIIEFKPKDGNHTNLALSNMLVVIDPTKEN